MECEDPPYDPINIDEYDQEFHFFGDSNSVIVGDFATAEDNLYHVVNHGESGQRMEATIRDIQDFVEDVKYTGKRIRLIVFTGHCNITYMNNGKMRIEKSAIRIGYKLTNLKYDMEKFLLELQKPYIGIIWMIPSIADFLRYNNDRSNEHVIYDMNNENHVFWYREAIIMKDTLQNVSYSFRIGKTKYNSSASIDTQGISDTTAAIPDKILEDEVYPYNTISFDNHMYTYDGVHFSREGSRILWLLIREKSLTI
ncbi:unnamed protein product [Rotaria socialis]|uniref:Uncharacterized protein n=1 Tax=Rotaria socialis TaxID=392032 RepID=A0A819AWF9_9BILA|nr:unnamed protein product [Rotaria socialis]CAF4918249.1 unnamed protein product [Rotaria socialis]